jgi:outer membrane protein OmpA-like peptidoglycan-associated protein
MAARFLWMVMLGLVSAVAFAADEDQSFTAHRFRPLTDPNATATVETADVPQHLQWHLGGFGLYEQNNVVRYTDAASRKRLGLLGHRAGAELGGGIGLFGLVALGATMPGTLLQLRTDGSLAPSSDTLSQLTPLGPGDARFFAKVRLLRQDHHLLSLALAGDVTLPTSLGLAYRGERFPTLSPLLAVSRTWWGLQLLGNAGVRLRGERLVGRQALTDEFFYKAALAYDLGFHFKRARFMPFGEFSGVTSLWNPFGLGAPHGGGRGTTPLIQNGMEVNAGLRWEIVDGWQVLGGVGVGALPAVGTPDFRVFSGLRFSYTQKDRDGDGILDAQDRCPTVKEDRDGFEDRDGCPELDNDGDGLQDAQDRCPDLAEDVDGFDDADGCPERDNDQDGMLDVQDNCPLEPGMETAKGCPDADTDGDTLPDSVDACPAQAEDVDGFDDADGCPEPDNDLDGVPDGADRCPFEAEDKDGFQDEDGCPDPDDDGDTVPDNQDACPRQAAPAHRVAVGDGCPDADSDKDGLTDSVDACPADPEDKDGFEDQDGCPERDNDRDGVLDKNDRCPDQAEVINGFKDEDGCPDEGPKALVVLTTQKIEILDRVYFDTGKATIQKRSYNLLNQVALTILSHPEIASVTVEGHTDSQGRRPQNLVLSQKRAESVRAYLVSRGVTPAMLRAAGYGPDRPLADNATAKGREQNRRVEFVLEAAP